jgi:phenylpropionate dioxygenase-like ring-hydroxylating dioxygenase large terminal subunit
VKNITAQQLDDEVPVTYGTEAFLSKDYAEAEKELLWPKVWQQAGRLEDIPNIGDYFTYEICDDSIIIIRTAQGDSPGAIKAFYNVCANRGRVLSHFEIDKMRTKWRQYCVYPANWKTAIEAFMEPYHTTATHRPLCIVPARIPPCPARRPDSASSLRLQKIVPTHQGQRRSADAGSIAW